LLAVAVGIVATVIERLFPEVPPGPLESLQALRNVPAPNAHAGSSTRAIERSENMGNRPGRECANEFGDANTRILDFPDGSLYHFGSNDVKRVARRIERVVK
jgi:hypothetical protein